MTPPAKRSGLRLAPQTFEQQLPPMPRLAPAGEAPREAPAPDPAADPAGGQPASAARKELLLRVVEALKAL